MKTFNWFVLPFLSTAYAMNMPNIPGFENRALHVLGHIDLQHPALHVFFDSGMSVRGARGLLKYFEAKEFKDSMKIKGNALKVYEYLMESETRKQLLINNDQALQSKLRELAINDLPNEIRDSAYIFDFGH